jgi:hypothetical protein
VPGQETYTGSFGKVFRYGDALVDDEGVALLLMDDFYFDTEDVFPARRSG